MARYFTIQLTVLTVLVTSSYGKVYNNTVFDNFACNGVNTSCAQHNLWCRNKGDGLVIKRAQYGCIVPQAHCESVNTTCTNWYSCCRYDKSDCLVDFNASEMSDIYKCSGLSGCKILPPSRGVASNCSDDKHYTYSRIQHGCSNASVIIDVSDKSTETKKNQVIIKYDKYDVDGDDETGGRSESTEMKKKKKKDDETDLGCHCSVSFITYIFLYQTNDDRQPINVGDYEAESDTWYKIDDGLGFKIILPKHNVNIILRAKNQHRKIQSVTCGCYVEDVEVVVGDTKCKYLRRANQTEVENFFTKEDAGSGKETVDDGGCEVTGGGGGGEVTRGGGGGEVTGGGEGGEVTGGGGGGEETEDGGNDDKDSKVTKNSRHDNSPQKSDKTVLIVGTVLGSLCLIIVIITITIILLRKWKNKKDNAVIKRATPDSNPSSVHDQHYYHPIEPNHVGVMGDVETDSQVDNYNHIGDIKTSNQVDTSTYNHIGDIKTDSQADTYNHIGDIKPSSQADTYNHIGDIKPSNQVDTSTYNHIGDIKTGNQVDTSTYNHIGDIKTGNQADTYNHIGDIKTNSQVDTYNHIGDIKPSSQADTYNHIGDIKTGNQADTYNHIGDFKKSNPGDTSNYDHIGDNKTANPADTSNYDQ